MENNIPLAPNDQVNQFLFSTPKLNEQNTELNTPLLKIDEDTISVGEGFKYLQASGELPKVLLEITRQYLIEKEIKQQAIEEPSLEILEQFILELRLQEGLTTQDKFQTWLGNQGLNYNGFRSKIKSIIQIETFKKEVAESQIESYFGENKKDLEKVILSRIIVENYQLAQDLKDKLEQQSADFTQLAKEYSVVDDAVIGGVLGTITRGDMPEIIAQATANTLPGQIVGPIAIENRYCLLKVEDVLTACLDNALKKELESKIFDEWLKQRLQQVNIQLLAFD